MPLIPASQWAALVGRPSKSRIHVWHREGRLPGAEMREVPPYGRALYIPQDCPRPEKRPPGRQARPREDVPRRPRGRPRKQPAAS